MRQTLFTSVCICTLALSCFSLSSFAQKSRTEYGKCGYYAASFQGRPTSSGEKYDKNDLTCSHKSLPFGTYIRVTRIDNNKSVVVRVNDRGPFIEGYVVDVSGAAAEQLDLLKVGTTRVKISVLNTKDAAEKTTADATASTQLIIPKQSTTAERPATYNQGTTKTALAAGTTADKSPQSPEKGETQVVSDLYKVDIKKSEKSGYGIQISTLFDANNVLPIINKLQSQWPDKVLVNVIKDEANNVSTYKIIVGPFTDKKTAESQQKLVSKKGYKKTFIVDLSGI